MNATFCTLNSESLVMCPKELIEGVVTLNKILKKILDGHNLLHRVKLLYQR